MVQLMVHALLVYFSWTMVALRVFLMMALRDGLVCTRVGEGGRWAAAGTRVYHVSFELEDFEEQRGSWTSKKRSRSSCGCIKAERSMASAYSMKAGPLSASLTEIMRATWSVMSYSWSTREDWRPTGKWVRPLRRSDSGSSRKPPGSCGAELATPAVATAAGGGSKDDRPRPMWTL